MESFFFEPDHGMESDARVPFAALPPRS
jgi:hypothetical protein